MGRQSTGRKMKLAKVIPPIVYRAAGATQAVDAWVWRAPCAGRIKVPYANFATASTSGTLTIRKARTATTAPSAGTAMLASTMSLAGTANTEVAGTLATSHADREFAEGDWIGIDTGGTLTNLAGLCVVIPWEPITD